MTDFKFILSGATNPDNIGACARALANFGFKELGLVNVFQSDWAEAKNVWLKEASVSAVDSENIINNAVFYDDIASAAADCDIMCATSSLHKVKPERDVICLSKANEYFTNHGYSKAGIVFGCEKTGLSKYEMSFCNLIINIPTSDNQPSINLGQSVSITAYALKSQNLNKPFQERINTPAPPAEIYNFTRRLQEAFIKLDGKHWDGKTQERLIRQALLDAKMSKTAINALKLLVK